MDTKLSFAEVSAQWIETKRKLVKHSTFCAYNLNLTLHLLPRFGHCLTISEEDAQTFLFDKLGSGLSQQSVRNIIAVLKGIVRYGQKKGLFNSPKWDLLYPSDTSIKALPMLSAANHRKLLKHLCEKPTTQNVGITLALCTGMRLGEVCALKWSDVDLARRTISISHTIGRIYNIESKTTERTYSSPKTKTSNRVVPISKELYMALKAVKGHSVSGEYVVGGTSRPKEPRCYRESFSRLLARLSIPKIVFHGLRHTFATRCIECGCDFKTVSVILGHSNVATTMNLYVHPNEDQKKRCIEKLSKSLSISFSK